MSAKSSKGLGHSVGISADFDITLRTVDVEGNILSERTPIRNCPNLITDLGMDAFGIQSFSTFSAYCHVGTGNTTPSFTDTQLVAKRKHTNTYAVGDGARAWKGDSSYTKIYTRVYQFAVGTASGDLTEIGISHNTTTVNTRALLKDAFGDPTTVHVAADEILIVTYRLNFTPSTADSTLVATQKGTEYTLTLRPSNLNTMTLNEDGSWGYSMTAFTRGIYVPYYYGSSSALGGVTGLPAGSKTNTGYSNTTLITETYVPGTYYTKQHLTFGLAILNTPDVGVIENGEDFGTGNENQVPLFKLQIGITPRLNKTSLDTVKLTLRTSWYRL